MQEMMTISQKKITARQFYNYLILRIGAIKTDSVVLELATARIITNNEDATGKPKN